MLHYHRSVQVCVSSSPKFVTADPSHNRIWRGVIKFKRFLPFTGPPSCYMRAILRRAINHTVLVISTGNFSNSCNIKTKSCKFIFGEIQKSVDGAIQRCDKDRMVSGLQQLNGLTEVARKAACSLRSRLFDVNVTLVVVIILILLAQSGVGLTA